VTQNYVNNQQGNLSSVLYMPWRCKSGVEIQLHLFLTSCFKLSIPRGRTPGINWIGGWVGTRACLYILENGSAGIPTSLQPACHVVSALNMLSELLKGQETVVRTVLW